MNVINEINNSGWHDWSFDGLVADYDQVTVEISYNTGEYYNSDGSEKENYSDERVIIHCHNHIGFSCIGHWDENIIESIKVEKEGNLISSSLMRLKNLYGESPYPSSLHKNINSTWYQLNIKLIDGNMVLIACSGFSMEIGE